MDCSRPRRTLLVRFAPAALLAGASLQGATCAQGETIPTDAMEYLLVRGETHGVVPQTSSAGTKTSTPLLETPQSISVVTQAVLREQDVQTLNQALRYVSGVTTETRGGTATRYDMFSIRGFDADTYYNGLKLLTNGEYAAPQVDPYLLDRVDVLKGSVSVLYGQAQAGGLVDQTAKLPTTTPLHEIGMEFGNFRHAQATGDFSGPIDHAGHWSYRLTALARTQDGQVAHTKDQRIEVAPALTWRPDARTDITLLGLYQHEPRSTSYGGVPAGASVLYNPFGSVSVDFYDGDLNFEKFDRTQLSVGLKAERQVNNWLTLRSNSRWFRVNMDYASVYSSGLEDDHRTLDRGIAASTEWSDQYATDNAAEARFSTGPVSHVALAGFDYQHLDSAYRTGFGTAPSIDIFAPDYTLPITQPARTKTDVTQSQYGVYLQDQLRYAGFVLTLSGRRDWVGSSTRTPDSGGRTAQWNAAFTGRAGLTYVFPNGIAPYISYSESFSPIAGTDANGKPFVPERGRQYEAGVKYKPRGFNGFFTAAAFDITRENLTTPAPNNPLLSIQTGTARSRGFEVEARTDITRDLQLVASYTYINAYYTRDTSGLTGKRLPAVPHNQASAWAYYTVPSGRLANLSVGGGARYVGKTLDSTNSFAVPDVTLFDLALRYDVGHLVPALKGLQGYINIDNLLDRKYVSSCYYGTWCAYGYQRTAFGGLTYRW
ncbi:TonB-dependent siderophore receptor [Lichenicola cladoniae]|uniref:TonB-dependent siderophore receptor n=1 Tax=Lichenicola cladoniae TaxID=1484109 RepID=A0A6M8HMA0_9PROT|nr:TonB-dependent siderophore receptor [Lichenicola cladoniae]NPD66893.1 TonB-dependent siderophore receptor [Acetobacteraceae bacterium]QKE89450.1 TonB-dependent siderophore receptor [Lichenicola cladoniae]